MTFYYAHTHKHTRTIEIPHGTGSTGKVSCSANAKDSIDGPPLGDSPLFI